MCWGGMPMGCPYGLRVKIMAVRPRMEDVSGDALGDVLGGGSSKLGTRQVIPHPA